MRLPSISGRVRTVLLILGIIGFLAAPARAQELGTAVLNGDVTDPTGAIVKGAGVVAQQKATGVERSTVTNGAGLFVFNDLVPGQYEIHVTAKGFSIFVAQVRMEIGQEASLKVQLRVASAQTTVEINDTDMGSQVNTVSSVVDGVVSAHQIDNLPLNGRNFLELSLLMPGNTIAPNFDPTKAETIVISSAGQLGRGGNVSVDGMDNNDDVVGGMLVNVPEDAVQEFQIATNRFSAETGRSGSSVVNVVTKSGTNTLHGSASFYERDKDLQALPATFNPSSTPGELPPFRREQYSGTLGGPIVKDKVWWFGAFEYRDELGGVLVGARDTTNDTITNSFASEPLTDPIGTLRGDWQISSKDLLSLHYYIERLGATGAASFLTSAPIGSASERQDLRNNFQDFVASWTHVASSTLLSRASFSFNNFINITNPIAAGPELDFPSIADGASYRVPQQTRQKREQFDYGWDWVHGKHNIGFGGEYQRIGADFVLGVFQSGAIEFVENFADGDHNGDGVVNDEDLLFAVTIRSAIPTAPLVIPNTDNNFFAGYFQDDYHVHPQLTLNLGLRYEIDTGANDVGYYSQINPILLPFLQGTRHRPDKNFAPRVGFNWVTKNAKFSFHGGYGIYYDRITLEIDSLERGLNGEALPIDVREGNVDYLGPTGLFLPGAPTFSNPFTGAIIPGAGGAAEGIDIIDNRMRNPMVQQFNLGVEYEFARNWVLRVDGIHDLGTRFIIGVPLGAVFNPASGGPETVTDLQSSANTHYDALWLSVDKRFDKHFQFHAAYTLSKTFDYANYDQVPFGYAPVNPADLRQEYGPSPNDQRHRLVLQGVVELPYAFRFSALWTYASGVAMDILYDDVNGNTTRVPQFSRNSGGREFHTGTELNSALTAINAAGGESGELLPLVSPGARFNDTFNSFDFRLSRDFRLNERYTIQLIGEAFNIFNKTNILGVANSNYSGFFNVLVPDNNNPSYSSQFGTPVSTAGGVFGSGGPRAFQLAARFMF